MRLLMAEMSSSAAVVCTIGVVILRTRHRHLARTAGTVPQKWYSNHLKALQLGVFVLTIFWQISGDNIPLAFRQIEEMHDYVHAHFHDRLRTRPQNESLGNGIDILYHVMLMPNICEITLQTALRRLERKKVDEMTFGPDDNTNCIVCYNDVTLGETLIFLACAHWFHEECVVQWLREHNTCPFCRKSIHNEQTVV